MSKSTDSRQLRMLIDGVLAAYGIDDLKLSIDLCEAVKTFWGTPTPVKTRETILEGVRKALDKGSGRQAELDAIRVEIETRIRIRPVGQEWEDFIQWAWKQSKKGDSVSQFLNWWVSDEWRLAHPPVSPRNWYVQWPLAFKESRTHEPVQNDDSGIPMSY